jgi:hypothetical protein
MISYYYITDIWTQVFVVMLNFKNRRIFKFRRQFLDTDDVCPSQLPCQMHKMSANVRWLCVSYRFRILILTTNLYRKYTNNRFSRAFTEQGNLRSRNIGALLLSCLVLSCLVLSCLVLSCLVLSCLVLSCLVLSCLVLSCRVLSCLVLLGARD